ncbi:MAG: glycosyltransferase family 39 protein [Planctomycetes bacterium]|nr:glycosyltransferase family 39 protein [Planctomycetota bacterium]
MLNDRSKLRRVLLAANLILLFAAATLCRALLLDHVPGLNGDEAWQGVQVQRWLRGEPVPWRTPTGNLINPLSFLPMAALHIWLPPSITLLRLTPLLSGLAALAVNYWLCRRVFDRQLAAISTVILAVLPATITYSRFAWDASQSVLVTLPVMYCALGAVREPIHRRGWLLGSVGALCLACLVHPTNVFMAPLIAAAAVWCWHKELLTAWQAMDRRTRAGKAFSRLATLVFLSVLLGCGVAAWQSSQVVAAVKRFVSPSQAVQFAGNVVDLISGTTVYRYVPATQLQGAKPATLAYRLAAWIVLAAAGYGLFHYLRHRRHAAVRVLLVGFCAALVAFYMVAGPQAIRPHFERYGMWMIGPSALLMALGVRWWMQRPNSLGRLRPAVALLLAWVVLAGFGWYYFRPILGSLGDSHVAFRTAKVEPKLAALRMIVSQHHAKPSEIVAQGWWVYWPLAYLAGADPQLSIVPENVPGEIRTGVDDDRGAWRVSWADRPEALANQGSHPEETILCDAAGRPLLRVVRPVGTKAITQPASLP